MDAALDIAIEAVGKAMQDTLTHQLIDYLMGEIDGIPKAARLDFTAPMYVEQNVAELEIISSFPCHLLFVVEVGALYLFLINLTSQGTCLICICL